jgi:hypothetical protein
MLYIAIRNQIGRLLLGVVLLLLSARAASAAPFVYALDQVNAGANQIYGFSVNLTSGALTLLPGFPVASGGLGGAGSFSEHLAFVNGRLHVVNEGSSSLSVFAVNGATGMLTAMPFSPIALTGDLACVAVHPSGSPIIVGTNAGVMSIVATATTATIAAGSPFSATGASPYSCKISSDGTSFYTGGNVGSVIAGFSVARTTGVLTPLPGSPFDTLAGNPVGYATDPTGRLFTSNFGTGVRAFTTAAGVPSAVSGNPFASGLSGGVQGIFHPDGFYVVADRSANRVGVFRIAGSGSGTTLAAVAGSPFTTGGSFSDAVAASPEGGLVVAANGISRNLTVFRMNTTTGALTSLGVQPINSLGAVGILTGLAFASFPASDGDFDGENVADITVYRPSNGNWFTLTSASNFTAFTSQVFGVSTDKVVAGDYDGDGKIDNAVFRPSTGTWFMLLSSTNYTSYISAAWGISTDKPVPADYDGDGQTDVAVYRPSTGTWYILKSSSGYTASTTVSFGVTADVPVPGDFDGDGRADIGVFRGSTGQWFVLTSSSHYTSYMTFAFGTSGDIAVPGDYDGDFKNDPAVFRPSSGTWFVLSSTSGYTSYASIPWGTGADSPVPGDYDGDGRTDLAVFRPSTGQWFISKSSTNYTTSFPTVVWGVSTDTPILKRQ